MICDSCLTKKPYKCFRKLKKFILYYKAGEWKNVCIECERSWLKNFGRPAIKPGEDPFTLRFD